MSAPVELSAPAAEPVTLAEAKRQLRLEVDDTAQDTYLAGLIKAARLQAEMVTRRAFVRRTFRQRLDAFPCGSLEPLRLGPSPLGEVESIVYIDTAGAEQTWSDALYVVDEDALPARVLPAYGQSWPSARLQPNAVTVTYSAGYAADDGSPTDHAANVPQTIKQAILLLVTHWFENRSPVVTSGQPIELPHAVGALLWGERVLEL